MYRKIVSVLNLKELLRYDIQTGQFFWANQHGNRLAGSEAGKLNNDGYIHITINRVRYAAHRLAWAYVYGHISQDLEIDHINRNRADNRIANLRLVTALENSKNRTTPSHNGVCGISYDRERQNWRAYFRGRTLGRFASAFDALRVRKLAESKRDAA